MIEISWGAIVGGLILFMLCNVLVWVYAWGRTLGKINEHDKVQDYRLKKLEDQRISDLGTIQKQLSSIHMAIIPECQKTFTELKTGQARIEGQVETILSIVQDIRNGKSNNQAREYEER